MTTPGQAAPELAAAMAETRIVREALKQLVRRFADTRNHGWTALISGTDLRRLCKHADIPMPDSGHTHYEGKLLTAYEELDLAFADARDTIEALQAEAARDPEVWRGPCTAHAAEEHVQVRTNGHWTCILGLRGLDDGWARLEAEAADALASLSALKRVEASAERLHRDTCAERDRYGQALIDVDRILGVPSYGLVSKISMARQRIAREALGGGPRAPRPTVACLCGSTRFYDEFQEANYDLTMRGEIVLSVGFYPHAKAAHGHGEGIAHDSAEKVALDELHKRKIDLADYVYVLNVGGYIGESTRSEIDYAIAHGKPVRYLEGGPRAPGDGGEARHG